MSSRPVVAIFNSNDDVVEMLRFAFERAGLVVVSGHIDRRSDFGSGKSDERTLAPKRVDTA